MAEATKNATKSAQKDLPLDDLSVPAKQLLKALMARGVRTVSGKVEGLTERLSKEGASTGAKAAARGAEALAEGKSPIKAGVSAGVTGVKEKAKDMVGGGGGKGGGGGAKVVNIVEEFDVGLPIRVAYNQWTQFEDFPGFTKKLESVEQESDEKINWRAKIFFSHRRWESTITEQIPDDRIVWRSKGPKGYVDGAVTFHRLAPTLTRVLLVAEYHPDGFFEKTANMWRAQGRRLRLEFKHIKRHMMTHTILEQQESEGWRGVIRDGEVVKTHEDAIKEEQQAEQKQQEGKKQGKQEKREESRA